MLKPVLALYQSCEPIRCFHCQKTCSLQASGFFLCKKHLHFPALSCSYAAQVKTAKQEKSYATHN